MKNTAKTVPILSGAAYAYAHFATEVLCFAFLAGRDVDIAIFPLFAILFDALAFLPQTIIGIISDRFPKFRIELLGVVLMLIGWFTPKYVPALMLLGVGNAFLHLAGAEATLRGTDGKLAPVALFVGGGSFGVITGKLMGPGITGLFFWLLIPFLLAFSLIPLFFVRKSGQFTKKSTGFKCVSKSNMWINLAAVFFSVAARSYMAYAIPTSWNKSTFTAVLLFVFMGIGKILGGIFADVFGCRRSAVASLAMSLPFLCFGDTNPLVSLIGVMFFSMTMANSAGILVSMFPRNPGMAFGVTTLALFCGVFPAFFVMPATLFAHVAICIIVTVLAIISFLISADDGNAMLRRKK